MAKPKAVKEQYAKVVHNTAAFEEAVLASVRAASLPAQRALAEAKYVQAKALLLKVSAYFLGAVAIFIVLWLFFELAKYGYGLWKNNSSLDLKTSSVEKVINDPIVLTKKEIELRTIVNQTLESQDNSEKKTKRPKTDNVKNTASSIIKSNSRIGELIDQQFRVQKQEQIITKTEVVENMVVGPEVQTLTVFNQKNIRLQYGISVDLVAGHRYSNNSSTTTWRGGYCYVRLYEDGIEIKIDLSTKAGQTAQTLDDYLTKKEITLLGGSQEVAKLRRLCPWLS